MCDSTRVYLFLPGFLHKNLAIVIQFFFFALFVNLLAMAPGTETPNHPATPSPDAHKKRDAILTDQTNLLPFGQIIIVFFGLALCIVVSTLDSVIVATSLPTISAVFNAGSVISWVPSAYLLTSTSFQPLYGRFSDIFGRKAALSLGMSVFIVGNLIAGFSKSITQVIVFRGFAGAGGGSSR